MTFRNKKGRARGLSDCVEGSWMKKTLDFSY
jgi:hypothetical protein